MERRITLEESEEGSAIRCNDLPGGCSRGATRGKALGSIREAIREWPDAQPETEARLDQRAVPGAGACFLADCAQRVGSRLPPS